MKKIIYILLFTISITYSFTAFSQNIDKRLIGKWKIKYEGNNNALLVKDFKKKCGFESFYTIDISKKQVVLAYRPGPLICASVIKDSTSATIDNNVLSLYILKSYSDQRKYSETIETYKIQAIRNNKVVLKTLNKKNTYF